MRRSFPATGAPRGTPTRKLVRKSASAKDIRCLSDKVRDLASYKVLLFFILHLLLVISGRGPGAYSKVPTRERKEGQRRKELGQVCFHFGKKTSL